MTSNKERLEELRQQAKELAEQIDQLEDQLNNTQPTSGLLGRWAKHSQHGDVLIADDQADNDGQVYVRYLTNEATSGALGIFVPVDTLAFPEQTTRPEDVPVGEAWLVDAHNGFDTQSHTPRLKSPPAYGQPQHGKPPTSPNGTTTKSRSSPRSFPPARKTPRKQSLGVKSTRSFL